MTLPEFNTVSRPFDSGVYLLGGSALSFIVADLWTWFFAPGLTLTLFLDLVASLLVLLGCISLFETPSIQSVSVVLVGVVMYVAEASMMIRSFHWRFFTFFLFVGASVQATAIFVLWLNHDQLSQLRVERVSSYMLMAGGASQFLSAISSAWIFGFHLTTILFVVGAALISSTGYFWLAAAPDYENNNNNNNYNNNYQGYNSTNNNNYGVNNSNNKGDLHNSIYSGTYQGANQNPMTMT